MGLDPYASCFNETGTFRTLPYHPHVNNAGLFDKGYTFPIPDDHVYHHLVDQRRRQPQGTSDNNYQILGDRYAVASQSLGGGGGRVKSPIRFSQITPPYQYPPNANITPSHYYVAAKEKAELSPFLSPRRIIGEDPAAAFRCDNNGVFLQGRDAKHYFENEYGSYRRSPRYDDDAIHGVGRSVVRKNFYSSAAAPSGQRSGGDFSSVPMLQDFYSVPDAQCYIYNMAKDQNGCRFLQRMVAEGTYQDICMVFEGIIGNVVELMIDSFGNYLVQKLLDVCTDDQRLQIVLMLTNHPAQLVRVSLNTHGYERIEISWSQKYANMDFSWLRMHLESDTAAVSAKLLSQFKENFVMLSTQKFSSHVVEKCLQHIGDSRSRIVRELLSVPRFEQLLQDQYANYVIQSALLFTKVWKIIHSSCTTSMS
ncbi:Putative pumilio like 7, chloroplastic [Glycine soja]|uniref:Putative pumilio like 7, chloroplastic n=1 Tax=Glycine soja TaxID=3848 RepID=A0A0B2P3T5_GLYSO|nr:Putative pumilio like 7, chloroplastic [Glycine soja]